MQSDVNGKNSVSDEQSLTKTIYSVPGIRIGVVEAGIKYANRKDLVLFELSQKTQLSAVFTQNAFCAAPVKVAKQHLEKKIPRYLLINTGNANAGTGEKGVDDALACCQRLAENAGCEIEQVLPFSTGVIGEDLPVEAIAQGLPGLVQSLHDDNWQQAAEGILTTDTRCKIASKQIDLNGSVVTVTGIAKGAGMIKPNMATMLAYVATDACVDETILPSLLKSAVDTSFNRITVDGDTSTNDACVLMATGEADNSVISSIESDDCQILQQALNEVVVFLAQGIIKDAEGGTKFITINVVGGKTEKECLQVAYTIAESPLVKTALFASDPNWGRILAAVGRSGVDDLDCEKVSIFLDNVQIVDKGGKAVSYTEKAGQQVMDKTDIGITVDLNRGHESTTVWTSDLSYDYIKINAEYRT